MKQRETQTMIGRLHALRRFLREKRGTAAIEFAFVAPVLFGLTIGTIDIGRLVWSASMLHHMAREATRYASVRGSDANNPVNAADIDTFVANRLIGVPSNDVTVTSLCVATAAAPPCGTGDTIEVQLDYTYSFLLGKAMGLDPLSIEGESSMVVL
jgi:Flp pilus assembly protein TadG